MYANYDLLVLDATGKVPVPEDEQAAWLLTACKTIQRLGEVRADGDLDGMFRWKTFGQDMRWFSSQYPQFVFRWVVTGENNQDLDEHYYFHDGKYQFVEPVITYPPFDPNQLS